MNSSRMDKESATFAGVAPAWVAMASLVQCLALCGCQAPSEDDDDDLEAVASMFTTTTWTDDSAGSVHVQVRACTSNTAEHHPSVDCLLDAGYAVVGGGAYAQWTGWGALLTASRPSTYYVNGRGWYGASKDHEVADVHKLTTYAIGLRLDGVNAETLRGMVVHQSLTAPPVPGGVPWPSVSMGTPTRGTSAGAQTNTSGNGQLLTRVRMTSSSADAASKDHMVSSPGTISDSTTAVSGTFGLGTIIEGFGALEVRYRSGTTSTVSTGIGTSSGTVSSGWALAGYGGDSTFTSGPGRMLFRIGADSDARSVIVQSKDHGYVSAGSTTAWWTEIRKTPGSHGLCNPGGPLATSMDPCVASICAADSYCCNTDWDSICVDEATSICGRSCADYTCGLPSYHPSFWNDDSQAKDWNDCYNYANNRRTDTMADVGRASGEYGAWTNPSDIIRRAVNDGLIPTSGDCPDGLARLALVIRPTTSPDYHWYREDLNPDGSRTWSHKRGSDYATNLDDSNQPITDPRPGHANTGEYTYWGGYFCTCSSATEGAGHAVIE